jgi:uncharacterized ferredoxin-like protein
MPIISSEEGEKEGMMQVAKLMLVSARTAPKSGGVDAMHLSLEQRKTLWRQKWKR